MRITSPNLSGSVLRFWILGAQKETQAIKKSYGKDRNSLINMVGVLGLNQRPLPCEGDPKGRKNFPAFTFSCFFLPLEYFAE
jgi:hypothetical protein